MGCIYGHEPVGTLNGSSSTYFTDTYWISTASGRVVYRGNHSASANGGVSCANANNDASYTYAYVGRAWPSAAKSSKRSALPRSKRWPRPRKRKRESGRAATQSAKRQHKENGLRTMFEGRSNIVGMMEWGAPGVSPDPAKPGSILERK